MNVNIVSMDPRVAAIHYKDYRKKVREHRAKRVDAAQARMREGGKIVREGQIARSLIEKEDETLMLSYREMARGQRILNLAQVMRDNGIDQDVKTRLPVLAIAQADWPEVWLRHADGNIVFSREWCLSHRNNQYRNGAVAFSADMFPAELTNVDWRQKSGLPGIFHYPFHTKALVPAIPAHLRPAGDLSGYHILWEAKWVHEAPPDPLLLKHVYGHVYTVLAQWDLTPIEKAILEGR